MKDDCISRKYLLSIASEDGAYGYVSAHDIANAPSVKPQEPNTGRWERHYLRPNVYADLFWHCSTCGYKSAENYANVDFHFCPNCGAKMEG